MFRSNVRTSIERERRPFLRFLLFLLAPPLLVYFAAFPLVKSASFEQWCPSKWGPMLEWPFDAKKQDADIVIFGDSSAFLGVDPRIVSQELGVKSVVLPNTIGSLPVIGDLALRHYLAHNRPPKVIVLYFSTWNLDFDNAQNVRLFEGEEMLLRHSSWQSIKEFGTHHPLEILAFPLRLYSSFGPIMMKSLLHREDRERTTAGALGHVDDYEDFPALSATCDLPASYFNAHSESSVIQLRKQYSSPQTRVMIYLAPVPRCRNTDSFVQQASASFEVPGPAQLPPSGFVGDGYYAHIEPSSVAASSRLLAEALEANQEVPQ